MGSYLPKRSLASSGHHLPVFLPALLPACDQQSPIIKLTLCALLASMDPFFSSRTSLLESIFYHVALPPRLPGRQENKTTTVEQALADHLLKACQVIRDLAQNNYRDEWEYIRRLLQTCKTVNAGSNLNKSSLLTEFRGLERNDLLVLHVTEQNAGLLIRRDLE